MYALDGGHPFQAGLQRKCGRPSRSISLNQVRHDGSVSTPEVPDPELIEACQAISLHLLERFSETCRSHGWVFHLGGGTLLGAIRNGRFIPWDDDIDITMPRADYERMRAEASADPLLFGSDVIFDDSHSDSQIGHLNYLPSQVDIGHVRLDVLVMDTIPDGPARRWLVERLSWAARIALANAEAPATDDVRVRALAAATRAVGAARMRAVYDGLLHYGRKHGDGTTWNCLNGSRPMGRARPSAWYRGTRTATFEGREYPVPDGAEAVLAMVYGPDYMTPKAGSARHFHRPLVAELGGNRWELL